MPVIATMVQCEQRGFEIKSDGKLCPKWGDKIMCADKYETCGGK